jgi:aryl-phospho-beta-D-glucosidase BglC (GH1 family)
MPDTSERVTGTLIAETALPLTKMRRVFDRGSSMMSLVHKRAEDTLDYFIDLLRWLEPDESIVSCEAYTGPTEPQELVIDRLNYAGTGVVLWIKGGGDGARYTVFCKVVTSRGKVKLFRFVMVTRGLAEDTEFPDLALLSIADCVGVFGTLLALITISDCTADFEADPEVPPEPVYPITWLRTSGAQILDGNDNLVRLRSVNWFGAEGTNNTPHGTWLRRYTDIIDQMVQMGFNTIRLPIHGGWGNTALAVPGTAIDFTQNPEFVGKTAYEILDLIVDYCETLGVRIVLDHHRRTAGAGADGSPVGGGYTEAAWQATWVTLATRYGTRPVVCGADLHNEPHDLTWAEWRALVQPCAAAIHAVAPEWLIFVEGVGGAGYWWGGNLSGVASQPVSLSVPNKLVYSPHEYGQSVSAQTWLKSDSNPSVAGWPLNLYPIWRNAWGFIFEEAIAPIWVGEFGGILGVNGSGAATGTTTNIAYEREWLAQLVKYLNADFDGDGVRDLPTGQQGMSFAYWSFNPNSADTGGLVRDDWITPQTIKLEIIAPLLTDIPTPTGEEMLTEDGTPLLSEDGIALEV